MLCLYNIPKGNEYIRTGAKECEVTVRFNDNSYIKRTRTLKSTGTYTVCTADGEMKEFDSFANNLPIDLDNEDIEIEETNNVEIKDAKNVDFNEVDLDSIPEIDLELGDKDIDWDSISKSMS